MRNMLAIIIVPLFITACTTTDEIIIDEKGVNMSAYQQDLAECQRYTSGVKSGKKTAKGAASGSVIGGLIGGITGGASGGAKGAREGEKIEVRVVKRCLSGRGYRVLNY